MTQAVAHTPTGSSWIRRHRAGLLIAAALLLATTFSLVAGTSSPYADRLDPDNPGPDGSRAVARVLDREGVRVEIVRDAADLDHTTIDDHTLVAVTSVGSLGQTTADRLLRDVGDAPLLLIDPPVSALRLFRLDGGIRTHDAAPVRGACDDARFDALHVQVDQATAYPGWSGPCFATPDGALLVRDPDRSITVLGAGDLLTNDQITRSDNAAVALRLLGAHPRLVWYVPDVEDLRGTDAVGLGSLLPRWLEPGLWLGALAMIAVVLWRGRRLGPLVSEPLPVAVTAIESTRSRGRLYRKVSDRAHAAATLRQAARRRIAEHLHLPRSATSDPEALIRDMAGHTGRDPQRLRDLLSPNAEVPRTDKDLTQLANDLAELEREVRRS